jgi:hypothetical protein
MVKQSYAQALVDALYDSLAADPRVSLIGSYVLGLGPQRHLMDRLRKDFRDRIDDPPTAEAPPRQRASVLRWQGCGRSSISEPAASAIWRGRRSPTRQR